MARDKGKSKDHRGTKQVYKKGSNPLDLHERYRGDAVHPHAQEGPRGSKSDKDLERDVREELALDPKVDEKAIAISAKGRVVTLSGSVPTYAAKVAAYHDAERLLVGSIRPETSEDLEQLIAQRARSHTG